MAKTSNSLKYVYLFGNKKADGNGSMKPLLGGKGANLAEMTRIGLPVPPGFTITTEVCTYYYANKRTYPKALDAEVKAGVAHIEKIMGTKFGDKTAMPLLVSVRSGARDSMPGMMDTILNLGLNDETVLALVKATKNERFAWDCYRRFIQMYGDVVMGVQKRAGEDHEPFEVVIDKLKHERHHADIEDTKLTVADLKELVTRFKALIKERTGNEFPQDPWKQLWGVDRRGVWFVDERPRDCLSPQIRHPRRMGNGRQRAGDGLWQHRRQFRFGRGVHARPGDRRKSILRRISHQRAGRRRRGRRAHARTGGAAQRPSCPQAFAELENIRKTLEPHFKDVQDFEFTIQDGKLFMLQTRNGKRTGLAAVRFAVEMEKEKLIDWKTAIRRVPADQLDQVLAPVFDRKAVKAAKCIAQGLPAGPGRGFRQDLSQRRPRGGGSGEGRKGAARPQRNFARRFARHDCRRRHSDGERRRQFARGAGGPADGQGLRLRRRRVAD